MKRADALLPITSSFEGDFLTNKNRLGKRRRTAALTLGAVALSGIHIYWADVQHNRQVQATAEVSINVVGDALHASNNDSAIVFINGFGEYNGDQPAESIGPGAQQIFDGQLWSVDYGDAPLSPANIMNTISETAEEKGVTSVTVMGYSAGGIIACEAVTSKAPDDPLKINGLFGISQPSGYDAVRPARRKEIESASALTMIPGAVDSTAIRFIGELAFRHSLYDDGNLAENTVNIVKTGFKVGEDINEKRLPGTWLLIDQILAISTSNTNSCLKKLGEQTADTIQPIFGYMGTGAPGYDYMVDDALSSAKLMASAAEAGLPHVNIDVTGAVHSRPDMTVDAYTEAFAKLAPQIKELQAEEAEQARLRRVGQTVFMHGKVM